jgi:hypothetical protein
MIRIVVPDAALFGDESFLRYTLHDKDWKRKYSAGIDYDYV